MAMEALDACGQSLGQQVGSHAEAAAGSARVVELGLNLGIPHVRIKTVKDMAVAIALVKDGIDDYESLDSEPVKLVFMIIARDDQHAQHLKFLSQLSTILKDDDFRNSLLSCTDTSGLYKLLCGGEC